VTAASAAATVTIGTCRQPVTQLVNTSIVSA
jgi:hypothetical protein